MTDQTNKDPLEALSCPFCGSDDISDGEVLSTNPAGGVCTQSMCRGCGALGPEAQLAPDEIDFGDEKAITAWNRRAVLADSEKGEPESMIGVGDGSGSLVVRGSYEAVKRVQGFIFDAEKWRAEQAASRGGE